MSRSLPQRIAANLILTLIIYYFYETVFAPLESWKVYLVIPFAYLTINFDFTMTGQPEGDHDHHHHDPNRHDDSIRAHAFTWTQPVHAVALTLFLEILAEHCGPDLLRLKGIVNLLESPDSPAVIHGVQNVIHPLLWLDAWPDNAHHSKFVFITKDLPGPWFETLLEAVNAEVAETIARRDNTSNSA